MIYVGGWPPPRNAVEAFGRPDGSPAHFGTGRRPAGRGTLAPCRMSDTVASAERITATFTDQVSGNEEITADIGTSAAET